MLTERENDRLSHVGSGTPMGNMLRRYWHPVATIPDLDREKVLAVRILGEDLALYRSDRGEIGLVQQALPPLCIARLWHTGRGRHPLPLPRLVL